MAVMTAVVHVPVTRYVVVVIAMWHQRWTVPIQVWSMVTVVTAPVRSVSGYVIAIDRRTVVMSVNAMATMTVAT